MRLFLCLSCVVVAVLGCGEGASTVDAGPLDAGRDANVGMPDATLDATTHDAGSVDASNDAAFVDAALIDASREDAGLPPYVEPTEVVDLNEVPSGVPTVSIEISASALQQLNDDPFSAADALGTFVDADGVRYENIELNFRGAYALWSLINSGGPQRNWKVKLPNTQLYRGRREWNFNYEPHLRQKLAYDLMRFAGVKVVSARHVLLVVNGTPHGLYLEYEDVDNKPWLREKLGDDRGDLYKAATDLPGLPRYFATTEYLGDTDADYALHYNKKTNNNTLPVSYERLRVFLAGLNHTSQADFPAWIEANFDVPKLIQYLVVANFISHWDGLPQRPKNYWLYEIPAAQRWIFIPWDLDGTFSVATFGLNPMGTTASVYYQFDDYEPYSAEQGEGMERPLIRRVMAHPPFRAAYVAAYRAALSSYLDDDYLLTRVDALSQLLLDAASMSDRTRVENSTNTLRQFIQARHTNVTNQLDNL